MISIEKMRRLEIKVGDDWVPAEIGQTEEGDTFRLFEPDGTPVLGSGGLTEFVADSRPFVRVRSDETA